MTPTATPRARQAAHAAQAASARRPRLFAALVLAAALAACGGGDDDSADTAGDDDAGPATALTCNTALFVAGAVELPSAAQLTAYAGTYDGNEGTFGPNPGDAFVPSGTAAVVLGANGSLSYKGVAYTPRSVCIDKAAGGLGKVLYVHTEKGHLDISNQVDAALGQAWGVSPADGLALFRGGKKR